MMKTNRLRRTARFSATLALVALMPSAPVHAGDRIETLAEVVTALDESAPVPVRESVYEAIGQGEASYYGNELAGNRTASGERFNPSAMTAAHRTLPLGTKIRVTNVANGRSVVVRINDRGPFVRSRLLDVSLGAAREIGMVRSGKAQVRLEIVHNS